MTQTVWSDDRGLLLGDGLFETLAVDCGAPFNLAAHLDRLDRGCLTLGLPRPVAGQIAAVVAAAVVQAGLSDVRAAARVTWSAGPGGRGLDRPATLQPRLLCDASPAPAAPGPARLATVSLRRNPGSPLSRLKSLSYLDNVLARREAQAAGADEALMLNTRGHIACAAAANLFWIRDGRLFTPALDAGVLDGTVRAAVLERAPRLGVAVEQVQAPPTALTAADALFLTNSLIGLRPVAWLDGRAYGGHALIEQLAGLCGDVLGGS